MRTQQSEDGQRPLWYVLHTRSHCEQLVCDQLAAKGFLMFLPKIATWSRRAGKRHLISVPMFPSYLFLQHTIDKSSSIEVRKARGLVRILGESWEKPSIVPDAEIEAIQTTLACVDTPHAPSIPSGRATSTHYPRIVARGGRHFAAEQTHERATDSLG